PLTLLERLLNVDQLDPRHVESLATASRMTRGLASHMTVSRCPGPVRGEDRGSARRSARCCDEGERIGGHTWIITAMTTISFDHRAAEQLHRSGKLIVARGYVHNSLGNLAIRVPHPDFPHGVAYTKHAEVSLEEMTLEHVVITDIPSPRLLHGTMPTSVGH